MLMRWISLEWASPRSYSAFSISAFLIARKHALHPIPIENTRTHYVIAIFGATHISFYFSSIYV